ncbi:hypothetical protein A2U04_05200 [Fusobacterium necrophorum subsp. funduliforme]|uniref:hypothetical protein n=1 Tax=Fusobacterium necrophorum TaxID=859 RepID=UPI000788D293|nr:hypothetical protein [Fusobacterium necrophorum]KYM48124.1 hypothetical protein A2U04_05200 [Fusobacterium necrophorum subsp. funduliforme]
MDSLKIYEKLDKDIRLNYNSKSEFAEKIGISKQRLSDFLPRLQSNKKNSSINNLFRILEKAGYQITIEKINHD